MSSVTARGIAKRYGAMSALNPLDLHIAEGEFLTLLGPSGCGKTTTLRLIAGFIKPSQGRILFGDDDVTRLPPQHRKIGMVFQDYALFPHLTIGENIGFGLVEQRRPAAEIRARVTELLELIRLPGLADRYPAELSGGQQQRIAVARAVAHAPRVLLMDEPLGALDLKLRETMQAEIRQLQQALKITTVYVTHDQTEAMNMSDRIAVMNAGNVEQIGSAADIYDRPASRFVAGFVGQINLLPVTPEGADAGGALLSVAGQRVRAPGAGAAGARGLLLGLRPEQLSLRDPETAPGPDMNAVLGRVTARQFSGNIIKVGVDVGEGVILTVDCHPNEPRLEGGARVAVTWNPDNAVLLPG